jgi:hypothetical protein
MPIAFSLDDLLGSRGGGWNALPLPGVSSGFWMSSSLRKDNGTAKLPSGASGMPVESGEVGGWSREGGGWSRVKDGAAGRLPREREDEGAGGRLPREEVVAAPRPRRAVGRFPPEEVVATPRPRARGRRDGTGVSGVVGLEDGGCRREDDTGLSVGLGRRDDGGAAGRR